MHDRHGKDRELRAQTGTWKSGGPGAERCTRAGRPRADRAAQFMPFAALTGYYELAREQELARLAEPRHELTEEEAEELSHVLVGLKRGDQVRVRRYERDRYVRRTGTVNEVDATRRVLRLGATAIPFDDIAGIKRVDHA